MKVFSFHWDNKRIDFSFPESPSELDPQRLFNILEALNKLEKKGFDDEGANIDYACAWLNCSKDELLNYADSNIYWEFRSGEAFDWFFGYLKELEKIKPPKVFELGGASYNIKELGKIIPYKIIMEMELALRNEGGLFKSALKIIAICLRVTEGISDHGKIEGKINETIELLKKEKADQVYSLASFFLSAAGFIGKNSQNLNYLKTLKLIIINQKISKSTDLGG